MIAPKTLIVSTQYILLNPGGEGGFYLIEGKQESPIHPR